MIKEKTTEEIKAHMARVNEMYKTTGKELYKKIADACQEELDLRAKEGQKKTEEPKPIPQPQPVQAEKKQDPQPEPKPEPEKQENQKVEHLELTGGVRGGKTQQVREWFELNNTKPAPKPTPKAPAKVHREFLPGLYIEEPATLGQLEVSAVDSVNTTTLEIPMVNGNILTATYGTAKARARQYFVSVMATEDFREKRYAAVLKSAMFKNLVRLVRGWGVLKSLDVKNPDYPTLDKIFKIQRQTRPERVEQAGILYQMLLEKVETEDKK